MHKKQLWRLRLINSYYSIPLKKKVFIAFTAVCIIPFILFSVISSVSIQRSNTSQLMYASSHAISQTVEVLDNYLVNIIYAADQFASTSELSELITRDSGLGISPTLMEDFEFMRRLMINTYTSQNMQKLTLYLPASVLYSNSQDSSDTQNGCVFDCMSNIENEKWFASLKSTRALWIAPEANLTGTVPESPQNLISYIRTIQNSNNYRENVGILKVDISQTDINKMLLNGTTSTYNTFLLVNSSGELIAYSDEVGCDNYASDVITFLYDKPDQQVTWEKVSSNHTSLYVSTQKIDYTDWRMVSITPASDIRAASWGALAALAPVELFLIVFCVLLSAMFSTTITRRISRLTENLKTVSDSHLPALMEESGSDEIGILITNYNYLIQKIQSLLKQQYKLGKDVEKARIKALQAQINPHFLYNTLDLINWKAIEKQVPDICDMIQNLSIFYKLNLSGGADFVTIDNEIKLIEAYINLQNRRYENRFSLTIDVSDEIRQCYILKMLLQPIVENAIIHGILENTRNTGLISISSKITAGDLTLFITDDGIGISDTDLINLNRPEVASTEHGYGIQNIRDRIRLNYGEKYSLRFQSVLYHGTTAEVTIPVMNAPPGQDTDGARF